MQNRQFSRLLLLVLILTAPSCAHVSSSIAPDEENSTRSDPNPASKASSDAAEYSSRTNWQENAPPENAAAILKVAFDEPGTPHREILPLPRSPIDKEPDESRDSQLTQGDPGLTDSPTSGFTLEDLEQIALVNNPTLQQAAAVVEKARGIRTQVGLYPNPTIGYSGEEIGDDGSAGQQGGFISQTIVTGGKLGLSEAVADQEIQSLAWELEAQRYRVRNAVRSQFYETLGAQQRVQIAERLLSVAQQGVNAAEELLKAQQAARPDVLQARIQLNEIRILLQNAQYDYEAAWKQLASIVGQPDLVLATLSGTLDEEAMPRDLETTFAELVAASPELQAARARVARARVQIQRQEVQPIPNVLAQVGVAHDNGTGDDIASVQLGIPLPIFNRNQGNIQLAVAEHRRALNDLRRLELALRSRLAAAFRDYLKAKNQVERYREDILPTAEENLNLTEEGYRQGEFDLIRALTARRSFFETNLAYINSQVALRRADVSISGLLLTGGLDDVPDAGGDNLQGVGLRDEALGGQ